MSALILDYSTDIQHYSAKANPQVDHFVACPILKKMKSDCKVLSNIENLNLFVHLKKLLVHVIAWLTG